MKGEEMESFTKRLLVEDVKGSQEVAYTLLKNEYPHFLKRTITIEEEQLIFEAIPEENMYDWQELEEKVEEEKLRSLINIGQLFAALHSSKYTYTLSPDSLVFTVNGLPLLIFCGIRNQVPPYNSLTEEEFLSSYKAMIISLLDKKVSYQNLVDGKLPFYKGKLFCETIAKAVTIEEIILLLQEQYRKEKEQNHQYFTRVKKRVLSQLKWTTIASIFVAILSFLGIGYLLLFAIPKQEMISNLRLAFINQDYSKVITTVKNANSKSLSQEDKYIVAYSVIKTEPLTDKQKEELEKISKLSNEDYLRYWVLIGQAKIDEAIDIASFLDDPQLLMYGMTKKIDEIQRNPNITSEERTRQLNHYKSKLDELKKKYLTSKETLNEKSNTTTSSGSSSNQGESK